MTKLSRTQLNQSSCDIIIFVNDFISELGEEFIEIEQALLEFSKFDTTVSVNVSLMRLSGNHTNKLIFSPTHSLKTEYDDSRRIFEASSLAIKRALSLGATNPLLILGPCKSAPVENEHLSRPNMLKAMVQGAFYSSYIPIETREFKNKIKGTALTGHKLNQILVLSNQFDEADITLCQAMNDGCCVARDIGGSDPERMAAPRIAEYIAETFAHHAHVQCTVDPVDGEKYPLMAAVERAAKVVPRHSGRIVTLEYSGSEPIDQHLFFVGKGITYDTGGANIKVGNSMQGMHRDKCGAAALVGFMKTVAILQPPRLHIKIRCAFVRNSIGEEAYVQDEIIVSRAGRRIRIGNTDAEGRMVMADLLCQAKEEALLLKEPVKLFTVATLTGHAILALGHQYTIVMCNGMAHNEGVDKSIHLAGFRLAEPCEISRIRREDMTFFRLGSGYPEGDGYADVLQSNSKPSSQTPRGHIAPAGFLMLASGLDEHCLGSQQPLSYTHIDCAGSSGLFPEVLIPTGAPLVALVGAFVAPRI